MLFFYCGICCSHHPIDETNNIIMAELTTEQRGGRGKRPRQKKLSTKVDLTPMVDLGFLLITFFVFTTSMTKPGAMKLYMPAGDKTITNSPESGTLTLLPVSGNKVFYYHGTIDFALQHHLYGVTSYSYSNGLGEIIRAKQASLDHSLKFTRADLMLIVKPLPTASLQNIVDIMDEKSINNVEHYALIDADDNDRKMLTSMGIPYNN